VGCGDDGTAPTSQPAPTADTTAAAPPGTAPPDTVPPADTSTTPPSDTTVDSTATPPDDSPGSPVPGIAFGSFEMQPHFLSRVHTGTVRAGGLSLTNIIPLLDQARAKGARVVLRLCMGRDKFVKNSDGTFSLTKWKALVDRFTTVDLTPYIADGTILGHFLIDEPSRASKWGGKAITQATVEEMARYSKRLWPEMTTIVRAPPTWLAEAPMSYTDLDAGWAQYRASKGEVGKWISDEVAAAKSRGLGLVVGMNLLDGGNGSSRIPGWTKGLYAMSASEITSYGTELLSQSYACGFFMWMHDTTYYGRSDVQAAMEGLSAKAKSHSRTSCRQ
jgi:hypothetical protein